MERAKRVPGFKNQGLVAQMVGRSGAWLSMVETGKLMPSLEDALMLANLLGVTVEELFPVEDVDEVMAKAIEGARAFIRRRDK